MTPPITRPQAQTKKRVARTRRRRIMATATVVLTAVFVTLLAQGSVQASSWDEIVALDTAKAQARGLQPIAQSIPAPHQNAFLCSVMAVWFNRRTGN